MAAIKRAVIKRRSNAPRAIDLDGKFNKRGEVR
jgi:hypothetical protein